MRSDKVRAQVKSRFYYIFWGLATVSVLAGQLYVGTGYRLMSESTHTLHQFFIELVEESRRYGP